MTQKITLIRVFEKNDLINSEENDSYKALKSIKQILIAQKGAFLEI
jgi:hypothetical protein